jgi:PHD/YefM family antitoxin component YafN of YafNO toxin-antitoxin module
VGIPKISSTEFQQNVGRYQDLAQRTPVAITKNGREHSIMMSATLFEVITKGRIARRIEDAEDETLDEISRAKVAPEHAHLDDLLKDWTP